MFTTQKQSVFATSKAITSKNTREGSKVFRYRCTHSNMSLNNTRY